MPKITLILNDHSFELDLEDNASCKALIDMLPLNLDLTELNGNEQYGTLPKALPTQSFRPKTIHKGDVLLFGRDTLVIFYKSFETPYSYTRLGHIADPQNLEAILRGQVVSASLKMKQPKDRALKLEVSSNLSAFT